MTQHIVLFQIMLGALILHLFLLPFLTTLGVGTIGMAQVGDGDGTIGMVPDGVGTSAGDGMLAGDGTIGMDPDGVGDGTVGMDPIGAGAGMAALDGIIGIMGITEATMYTMVAEEAVVITPETEILPETAHPTIMGIEVH